MNVCLPNMAIPVEEQRLTNMPLLVQRKEMPQCLKLMGG